MREWFDEFGGEDPDDEARQDLMAVGVEVCRGGFCGGFDGRGCWWWRRCRGACGEPERIYQGCVVEESEVDKGGDIHRVDAPRLGGPELGHEQASWVAAPSGPHPAKALAQIFGIGSERGLDPGLGRVLEVDLPSMLHEPAGDEIIVVGVERTELVEEKALVDKAAYESGISDDGGTDRAGSARYHEGAPVDVAGSCELEVVAFEVESSDEVPEAANADIRVSAAHPLACTDDADVGVLEGSENAWEEIVRPENMVIAEQDNVRVYLSQALASLKSLVGFTDG